MRTFKNTAIPKEYRGSAIAIGNFDGVHRGHQKVFRQAKKYAKKNKIKLIYSATSASLGNKGNDKTYLRTLLQKQKI